MTETDDRRRERLDVLLVERGLAPTRAKAQALILAGQVSSGEQRLEKPGQRVPFGAPLRILAGPRYVSRSAPKLASALASFSIEVCGRDALDVGASTGGFTQVLLEAGARRVVALDVGRGQLDWSLRRDPRVKVVDGLNARHLRPEHLPFAPSIAVVDVSFISLELVLPGVTVCLTEPGEVVALVKPQFEVGRRQVGPGGIVREPALHAEVLEKIARMAHARNWGLAGVCAAAVRGAEGNQEYCIHLTPPARGMSPATVTARIRETVDAAGGTSA